MYKLHKMRTKKDFDHQNEYNRNKYDRIGLMLPKGMGDEWKERAKAEGLSLNAYIIKCVNFYTNAEKVVYLEENSKNH